MQCLIDSSSIGSDLKKTVDKVSKRQVYQVQIVGAIARC